MVFLWSFLPIVKRSLVPSFIALNEISNFSSKKSSLEFVQTLNLFQLERSMDTNGHKSFTMNLADVFVFLWPLADANSQPQRTNSSIWLVKIVRQFTNRSPRSLLILTHRFIRFNCNAHRCVKWSMQLNEMSLISSIVWNKDQTLTVSKIFMARGRRSVSLDKILVNLGTSPQLRAKQAAGKNQMSKPLAPIKSISCTDLTELMIKEKLPLINSEQFSNDETLDLLAYTTEKRRKNVITSTTTQLTNTDSSRTNSDVTFSSIQSKSKDSTIKTNQLVSEQSLSASSQQETDSIRKTGKSDVSSNFPMFSTAMTYDYSADVEHRAERRLNSNEHLRKLFFS